MKKDTTTNVFDFSTSVKSNDKVVHIEAKSAFIQTHTDLSTEAVANCVPSGDMATLVIA